MYINTWAVALSILKPFLNAPQCTTPSLSVHASCVVENTAFCFLSFVDLRYVWKSPLFPFFALALKSQLRLSQSLSQSSEVIKVVPRENPRQDPREKEAGFGWRIRWSPFEDCSIACEELSRDTRMPKSVDYEWFAIRKMQTWSKSLIRNPAILIIFHRSWF